jgi:hypothetical protein
MLTITTTLLFCLKLKEGQTCHYIGKTTDLQFFEIGCQTPDLFFYKPAFRNYL